jgi:hypothetical protein
MHDQKNLSSMYSSYQKFPCDFDFGMASEFAKQFKPEGSRVFAKIRHEDHAPCRKKEEKAVPIFLNGEHYDEHMQ